MKMSHAHEKIINVIQFLAFEDLGSFAQVLQQQGYTLQYWQAGVDEFKEIWQQAAPLIILGGPIGVYETDIYPYLSEIVAQLKQRLVHHNYPTLGICLGSQLIAAALGAKVYAGGVKEIGWGKLSLTTQGLTSVLHHLVDLPVLHWHGDTFDLPMQATLLAGSEHYAHQAFSVGQNILALQFHPEVVEDTLERWLIGHIVELNNAGIDIVALREDNHHYAKILQHHAQALLLDWLAELMV
jgi:GMP synthase (glutamine-hydrolysing)